MSESRHFVITGVSRGLGLAMTKELIRRGHTVHGCARDGRHIATLNAEFGPPHSFAVVDVTDDQAVARWAADVLAAVPGIDLLLNNAAVINPNQRLWEISAAEFDRVIDINIKGVANILRHFVGSMVTRQRGVIINFSSGWGRSVSPEVAPYCATKYAIEGLTLALAEELPRGMAAIPLNPGIIDTDMLRSCFGAEAKSYPSADEWARAAVPFLLKLGPRDNGCSLTVK